MAIREMRFIIINIIQPIALSVGHKLLPIFPVITVLSFFIQFLLIFVGHQSIPAFFLSFWASMPICFWSTNRLQFSKIIFANRFNTTVFPLMFWTPDLLLTCSLDVTCKDNAQDCMSRWAVNLLAESPLSTCLLWQDTMVVDY